MEYNTERDHLKLREYGRNVQRMVSYIKTVEDREKRNSYAITLVELMKQINPNLKDSQEYEQKVWDDLFIVSEFELDIDSPYPKPDAAILDRKPDRVKYNFNKIKYRHYGRSLEILIEQAINLEDPAEKQGAVITIGKLMKSFYNTWNRENIEDEQVLKNIKQLSDNQLDIDIETVKDLNLFDMAKPASDGTRTKNRSNNGNRNSNKGKRNNSGNNSGNNNSGNNNNNQRKRRTNN
ncbi:MAG: hypothetical protein ACI8QD_001867 [Cyclobacteriaceae bacterium]|jgi:hypothetical protein